MISLQLQTTFFHMALKKRKRKQKDNKSKRKGEKRTQKETLLHEIERDKKQAFKC